MFSFQKRLKDGATITHTCSVFKKNIRNGTTVLRCLLAFLFSDDIVHNDLDKQKSDWIAVLVCVCAQKTAIGSLSLYVCVCQKRRLDRHASCITNYDKKQRWSRLLVCLNQDVSQSVSLSVSQSVSQIVSQIVSQNVSQICASECESECDSECESECEPECESDL